MSLAAAGTPENARATQLPPRFEILINHGFLIFPRKIACGSSCKHARHTIQRLTAPFRRHDFERPFSAASPRAARPLRLSPTAHSRPRLIPRVLAILDPRRREG